ncbi:LytTR family DNA-binding domain-containing protein [Maricaulis maris]|uniref:LytTr DNA-binding domain-containing protein n=1 Tax=Maricaulis maris TaxID=74318 RepID=A0A495D3V9_9PROT|nr:LytTR family DNA-binding domain-containing protein [Maricaulis maris]RKQ96591.1 LytTr DNA-binding domain-containing protein [Maricaulis maris]
MIERVKSWGPNVAIVLAAGTFLAILAPYETASLGLPWIWLYWTGLMALGWTCGHGCNWLFDRYAPDWPKLATGLATTLLVSIPVTAAVALLQLVLSGRYPLYVLPMIYFLVWVISAAVTTVSILIEQNRARGTSSPDATRPSVALTDKLPPRLRRADILALEAEDHYLRVHTDLGDCLILMRLSDAVAAVAPLDGARTHRSWWVARKAVERISRSDGRATLSLTTGAEAPVSRTYAPKLRDAGWY